MLNLWPNLFLAQTYTGPFDMTNDVGSHLLYIYFPFIHASFFLEDNPSPIFLAPLYDMGVLSSVDCFSGSQILPDSW